MIKENNSKKESLKRITKRNYSFKNLCCSLLLACFLTFLATFYFFTGSLNLFSSADQLNTRDIRKLQHVYHAVSKEYIENISHDKLIDGALNGMVSSTEDPFSDYLTGVDKAQLEESMDGSFAGIGAQIMSEGGKIKIVSPIQGSPAEKAGLKANDIILSADGKSLSGMTSQEAVNLIRGEVGTEIKLEILRDNKTQKVALIRDKIPIQTVTSKLLPGAKEIAYLQISEFSEPTYGELVSQLKSLQKQGAKKLILDLRGNPGGLLTSVVKIANIFLDEGDTIVRVEEKQGPKEIIKASSKQYGDFHWNLPMTVLIDEGSASASEILAGALKESKNIPLVGHTSFGKGTVQNIYEIDANSELKLTVAKWLTPKGNWIHKKGLTPNVKVDLPDFAKLSLINPDHAYKNGEKGDEVLNIQKVLVALSCLSDAHLSSHFDKATEQAVKKFQKEQNLPVNGIVDSKTGAAMMEAIRSLLKEQDTQLHAAIDLLK